MSITSRIWLTAMVCDDTCCLITTGDNTNAAEIVSGNTCIASADVVDNRSRSSESLWPVFAVKNKLIVKKLTLHLLSLIPLKLVNLHVLEIISTANTSLQIQISRFTHTICNKAYGCSKSLGERRLYSDDVDDAISASAHLVSHSAVNEVDLLSRPVV
jgi:hypothetical protein